MITGNTRRIVWSQLVNSLIGDDVLVAGVRDEVALDDHSEVKQTEA